MQIATLAQQRHFLGGHGAGRSARRVEHGRERREVVAGEQIRRALADGVRTEAEQAAGRGIDRGHGALGIDRHDAGGDAFEDGLDVPPPPFGFLRLALEIDGRAFQLPPAPGQFLGHAVEGLDQRAELVFGLALDPMIQVARADLAGGRGQQLHRAA